MRAGRKSVQKFSRRVAGPVRKENEKAYSVRACRLGHGRRVRANNGSVRRSRRLNARDHRGGAGIAGASAITQGNGAGVATAGERTTDRRDGEKQLQRTGPSPKF